MAVHDYCVHYGGCFEGSVKGEYDTRKVGVLWGPGTQGKSLPKGDLFGPPYGRKHESCFWDEWAVVHNRCEGPRRPPICFKKEGDELIKYHQTGFEGRKCVLDNVTNLPLPNLEVSDFYNKLTDEAVATS